MRLVYCVPRHPHLNTTFVLDEILALEARGHTLLIIACRSPVYSLNEVHIRYREICGQVVQAPSLRMWPIYGRNLKFLMRHPLKYASAAIEVMRNSQGSARATAKGLYGVFVAGYFYSEVRAHDPEWIHAQFASLPGTVAWVLSRWTGRRFSITGQGFDIFAASSKEHTNSALAAKLKAASVLVVTGNYMRAYICRKYGTDLEHKLLVVPNGIRLADFEASPIKGGARGTDARPMRIVSVGSYVSKKGHDTAIRALAMLNARNVKSNLRIIGPGDRQPYEALVNGLGLGEKVDLAGPVSQERLVPELLQADAFVLACRIAESGDRDGTPSAVKEAMALGRPVVSTPVSGIPELVVDGDTGLLVGPDDPGGLTEALERLALDGELRRHLGGRAREALREGHDIDANVGRLVARIEEALGWTR